MKKTAFLFPGQGSQITGMGLDAFNKYNEVKEIFAKADEVFGMSISQACFSGSKEFLQKTEIAQPSILVTSLALAKVLEMNGVRPDYLAGHSLGEYTALVYAGVLTFESALNLVKIRSTLMARAGEKSPGTMIAVIGMNKKELETECQNFSNNDDVVIANYNAPEQLVVSGTIAGIELFSKKLRENGKKVIQLNVSGAFHSHLMKSALLDLIDAIEDTEFFDAHIPIITNVDSVLTYEGRKFKDKIKWQLVSPVLWEDCVKEMISHKVDRFIEVGPQRVLTNLNRRIDNSKQVFNIDSLGAIDSFLSENEQPFTGTF